MKNLKIEFQSEKFRYAANFVAMKGAVDVKCAFVSFNTTIKVTRHELEDGRKVMAFKVIGFELTIPHKHVSLVMHGN